ncbi:hypothetical protein, partial [Parazoarcus communis]|uniref:hypothetical protein n=1 Tax=Parazoarcus communis TaxID=41977 RepID=UPI001B7D0200
LIEAGYRPDVSEITTTGPSSIPGSTTTSTTSGPSGTTTTTRECETEEEKGERPDKAHGSHPIENNPERTQHAQSDEDEIRR